MNEMPSFADPANLEPKTDVAIELEPNATSLTLLQKIYRSSAVALSTRMRAAIAAIQFEHPKLAVTANITSGDFAEKLDRAVERTRLVIEAKPMIEANITVNVPSETKATNGMKPPMIVDRRYRRW